MENQTGGIEGLFNPGVEVPEQKFGPTDEFKPSAAKGKNGVYQAIIRFVPWYKDAKFGSIREKWTCWLQDPLTEKGRNVDCPSSVGKPSILQDMYFKCKNSEDALLRSKMDIFSRRKVYTSLIQVIKDENNPELEGKILVYRYGVKIWDKINAELKPVIGDRHDPFDILTGKAFALIITKVSGYNNYDQSKFLEKKIPLLIPDEGGKLNPISQQTDKNKVFEFVQNESPDLEKYDFQEWDQDTHDYVNSIVAQVTGQSVTNSNFAGVRNAGGDGAGVSEASGITATDIDLGGGSENAGSGDPLGDFQLPNLEEDISESSGSEDPLNLDDALAGL